MSHWLYRIGALVARRRWLVLAAWLLVALTVGLASRSGLGGTVENYDVPGVESQRAAELLQTRFPERSGATATVVFQTSAGAVTDPRASAGIAATIARVRKLDDVIAVTDPLANPRSISPDGTTAFASVQYASSTADLGRSAVDALTATADPAEAAGVQVEYGGELPTALKEHTTGPAEMIGILTALVILFLTFRTAYAAVLPLGVALVGLLIGLSLVGILGVVVDIPSVASRLATMIGLGVSIDYALFVLSRHRDNLASGMSIGESIARTNASAGHAVVVAGGTVVVAILGLQIAGIPFVTALGYSASLVVAVAVLAAITLLPALLAIVGSRVQPRGRRHVTQRTGPDRGSARAGAAGGWVRWARWIAAHPARSATAATMLLLALALPVLDMRLGQADAGTDPTSTTHRRAYDLLAAGFGPGINGPLLIAVDLEPPSDRAVLDRIATDLGAAPGIGAVSPPELNRTGDTAVITALPTTAPQDQATSELVDRLRGSVLPAATAGTGATALVGGPTARFIDQSDRIAARLPWFIAVVVSLSCLLLLVVFRSVVLPLTAALLNLLSIGAAYGVVVAVFQWGWGSTLIGLEEPVPIAPFVPMMMFAILFGLSMDYEVFILSRIREEYRGGRTTNASIIAGIGATARVITSAALIMIAVFLGFVVSDDPVVKMMGVGLATAVAVDATLVRMVLVPAAMSLLGDSNWWLPGWLARILPDIAPEGGSDASPQTNPLPGKVEG